jgi:hypothetical protein
MIEGVKEVADLRRLPDILTLQFGELEVALLDVSHEELDLAVVRADAHDVPLSIRYAGT